MDKHLKTCVCCKLAKDESEYYKFSGRTYYCKDCCKRKRNDWYNKFGRDKDGHKKQPRRSKEEKREIARARYLKNKDYHKAYQKKYYVNNKKRHALAVKRYRHKNPKARIMDNFRCRLWKLLKNRNKKVNIKVIDFIGCTQLELIKHIESKFKDGMTWDNHNRYGWHIDHIIPCDSFGYESFEDIKKCFHYTNLQPLWAEDNMAKGKKKG